MSSSSVLAWKTIEPLKDIRYIGGDPYVLSIHADEPSWILARSAAHPQMRFRKLNSKLLDYISFVAFNKIHPLANSQPKPKDQQTSGRKRSAKGKANGGQ